MWQSQTASRGWGRAVSEGGSGLHASLPVTAYCFLFSSLFLSSRPRIPELPSERKLHQTQPFYYLLICCDGVCRSKTMLWYSNAETLRPRWCLRLRTPNRTRTKPNLQTWAPPTWQFWMTRICQWPRPKPGKPGWAPAPITYSSLCPAQVKSHLPKAHLECSEMNQWYLLGS